MSARLAREVRTTAALALGLGAALLAPRDAGATARRVPADYPTLGAALLASTAGDTVLAAPGLYAERVALASGVTLRADGAPGSAVIDAQGTGAAVEARALNPAARLEGFRLTGGAGIDDAGSTLGGDLGVIGGLLEVRDCTFDGAQASFGGGTGASGATVTFERCSWNGTHAGYGGGHFQTGGTVHFTDVSFSANTAGAGGAIFATGGAGVTLLGGVVSGASATGNGAGLHLDACVATLSNLRVDGASAGGLGGGLSIAAGGQVIASFCKFVECAAAQGGGAFHVSCDAGPAAGLFAPAAANIGGPASALTTDCALLSITHSDVLLSRGAAPAAGAVTDAAVLRIASSIVAGNQSGLACLDPRATLDVGCSDLYQNGGADLSGSCLPSASGATLAVDPRLCDLAGRDFGLCANSPLLDPGCGDAFWGAGGLSCGGCGPTPAQPLTWGKLKSLYRS